MIYNFSFFKHIQKKYRIELNIAVIETTILFHKHKLNLNCTFLFVNNAKRTYEKASLKKGSRKNTFINLSLRCFYFFCPVRGIMLALDLFLICLLVCFISWSLSGFFSVWLYLIIIKYVYNILLFWNISCNLHKLWWRMNWIKKDKCVHPFAC